MRTVIISTAYLPPLSWMAVASQAKSITIEKCETYPKQTFRNRCNIATSGGVQALTVPVKRINGNHTRTEEILVDNSKNWQIQHWRSIETAYNKSPYFLFYRDWIEPLYIRKFEYLVELNQELLIILIKLLNIKEIEVSFSGRYENNPNYIDLRTSFDPKKKPQQNLTTPMERYIQVFEEKNGFIPDLSIIDLLFNMGPEAVRYLRNIQVKLAGCATKHSNILL